jgi:3-hydroxyisobutyrate dehydrogenase
LNDATPAPTGAVAFIGLGRMGLPMAGRLLDAGVSVRGTDLSPAARDAFAACGGTAVASAAEAARDAAVVITMLPDGGAVRDALLGPAGAAAALAPGGLAIDMSSSAPLATRRLAADLAPLGIALVDAPVSGGVRKAVDGSLAIMAGGAPHDFDRARPLLALMGSRVFATGDVGSGHACKALNNYVSAAGLQAACEAALVAGRFGVDPAVLVDVLNASTGRNNATELKMKPHILSGTFASGFSLGLMAKDLGIAADLADALGVTAGELARTAALWAGASAMLGREADHTEIYTYLAARTRPSAEE